MPSAAWTRVAVAGKVWSGVVVARTMMSSRSAGSSAASKAPRAAAMARSEVFSPASAMWRPRIPVRRTIHWSEVSRRFASSALVTIRLGR